MEGDAVTIEVVKAARRILNGANIDDEPEKARVTARVFKVDGALEERYGDLAVVVRMRFRDGDTLEGVAFYEAKCREWNSNKLPSAKKRQLASMHRVLWNGQLLVFNRDRVITRLTEIVYAPWWLENGRYPGDPHLAPATHALAISLGPVLQIGRFDRSLYKFGGPFSSQLVLRNLQGLDLDHEAQVLSESRAYAQKKEVPRTIVRARVVLAVAVHEGPGNTELPHIDLNVLRPVDD